LDLISRFIDRISAGIEKGAAAPFLVEFFAANKPAAIKSQQKKQQKITNKRSLK
jgi:hypothetical protein